MRNEDGKGRLRTVTVAFRMSPEESEEFDKRVKLCRCKNRQDFIIESLLHQKIVTRGNPLMMVQFRKNLQNIEKELQRLQVGDQIDKELFAPIRTMIDILDGYGIVEGS